MNNFILFFFLIISCVSNAQDTDIPTWFIDEMAAEIGVWEGDNTAYKSDQEPFETYVLEWNWGINQKSIVGKMYAIMDGKKTGLFWEFRKYWDAKEQRGAVLQFGSNGTVGIGYSTTKSKTESELFQVFTNPDGTQYSVGHRSKILSTTSHEGASYSIDEAGKWTKDRSYIWVNKAAAAKKEP